MDFPKDAALPGLPIHSLVSGGGAVRLKPSVSLPVLHKPHGNLSRVGGTQKRLDELQRQFETAGKSVVPLARSERSRILAEPIDDSDGSGAGYDILYVDEAPADASEVDVDPQRPSHAGRAPTRVPAPNISAPPPAVLVRGSETNLLTLRLGEAVAKRSSSHGGKGSSLSDQRALDFISRQAAEDGLEALRQVADISGALGPTLHRVADALEPTGRPSARAENPCCAAITVAAQLSP